MFFRWFVHIGHIQITFLSNPWLFCCFFLKGVYQQSVYTSVEHQKIQGACRGTRGPSEVFNPSRLNLDEATEYNPDYFPNTSVSQRLKCPGRSFMVSNKIRRGTNKEKMSLNIILKKAARAVTYNIRLCGQTYQGASVQKMIWTRSS